MKRKRRKFTAAFKSKVALQALREEKPLAAIASRHRIHPNQVSSWKRKAIEGMSETFSAGPERRRGDEEEIRDLHAKIGELTIERDFLSRGLGH